MKLRKVLALALAGTMVFSLAACGEKKEDAANEETTNTEETTDEGTEATTYSLGMGVVVSTDSSDTGNAQVDATVATVVVDGDGVIVKCNLDVAQTKMNVADGVAAVDDVDLRSKQEKGSDYGMVAYGNAIAEWNEQADFFAEYAVGKTADEITGLPTEVNEEGHTVSTDSDLLAGCTMSIADFQAAIAKACNDEYAKTFEGEDFTVGLSCTTEVDGATKDASDEEDGMAAMYTEFAAVVLDKDNTILATLVDTIQPKIAFNKAGEITEVTFNGTKKELKDEYGMVAYGGAIAEWYEQATCFENYVTGKTVDEMSAIATVEGEEEGHYIATDADPDLLAGCTMSIKGYQESIAKAAGLAK